MKRLIITLSLLSSLASFTAYGKDRIGHGGGFYVCNKDGQIKQAYLIDFWEAENEIQLKISNTDTATDASIVIANKWRWLKRYLPDFARKISPAFDYVQAHWQPSSRLKDIPDEIGKNGQTSLRRSPDPSMCSGEWSRLQMANFTEFGPILYNEMAWLNPSIPVVQKAGLFFHEVIYFYLRSLGDETSSRTRLIVGYLFSHLNPPEIQKQIEKILYDKSIQPSAYEKTPNRFCIFNYVHQSVGRKGELLNYNLKVYFDYFSSEAEGEQNLQSQCRAENGEFDVGCRTLRPSTYTCHDAQGSITFACRIPARFPWQTTFVGQGRTREEARARAMKSCLNEFVFPPCWRREMALECTAY